MCETDYTRIVTFRWFMTKIETKILDLRINLRNQREACMLFTGKVLVLSCLSLKVITVILCCTEQHGAAQTHHGTLWREGNKYYFSRCIRVHVHFAFSIPIYIQSKTCSAILRVKLEICRRTVIWAAGAVVTTFLVGMCLSDLFSHEPVPPKNTHFQMPEHDWNMGPLKLS